MKRSHTVLAAAFVDSVYEIKQDGAIQNEGKLAFFPVMRKNSKMKDTGGWE
jgi:hypothetical protein